VAESSRCWSLCNGRYDIRGKNDRCLTWRWLRVLEAWVSVDDGTLKQLTSEAPMD